CVQRTCSRKRDSRSLVRSAFRTTKSKAARLQRSRSRRMTERVRASSDENTACSSPRERFSSARASRVCGGIRRQQAGEDRGNFDESLLVESTRVDLCGGAGQGRQGGELGDRVRQPECPAPAWSAQSGLSPRDQGDRERVSRQGWLVDDQCVG